jgi:hypothetical protein
MTTKEKQLEQLNIICLYSNCEMLVTRYSPREFKVTDMLPELIAEINDSDEQYPFQYMDKYKLLLRPLSSMTEDEQKVWDNISTPIGEMHIASAQQIHWAKRINYYRSIGIDCDGLIENGQAIDKTKL